MPLSATQPSLAFQPTPAFLIPPLPQGRCSDTWQFGHPNCWQCQLNGSNQRMLMSSSMPSVLKPSKLLAIPPTKKTCSPYIKTNKKHLNFGINTYGPHWLLLVRTFLLCYFSELFIEIIQSSENKRSSGTVRLLFF